MTTRKILLAGLVCLSGAFASGALNTNSPQIGYLYPAGGQKGTTVRITAGGQFLRGATQVHVTGEGVKAEVVEYFRPIGNLNKERRDLLNARFRELLEKRISELPLNIREKINSSINPKAKLNPKAKPKPKAKPETKISAAEKFLTGKNATNDNKIKIDKKAPDVKKDAPGKDTQKKEELKGFRYEMPTHPLLVDLENKSIRELEHIRKMIFMPRDKLQPNRQLAEMVSIEVAIDADAKPGNRELRIQTATGLSDPIVFQVGCFPEKYEVEPNNRIAYEPIPKMQELPRPKAVELPVVLNGQIMPGDVDHFRFRAEKGQKLVIEAHARSLIPYLADAVPGWFQATVALYRASGTEVAFADDYQFNPDPVMFYEIGITGEYELEIRDSIYRGREDFVYRIVVGQQPFITGMFPLGGKTGSETIADIDGWNITNKKLKLDTTADNNAIHHAAVEEKGCLSNSMAYAVGTYDECTESGSNDNIFHAQRITLPTVVNGRIEKPGDADVFRFSGKAGNEIVAEVYARRLNSPLDSLVSLTDERGVAVKWNDDYVVKESHLYKDVTGLVTHHADSYLIAKLPKDGAYYVHLSDSQRHGGKSYGYRLRVCERQGDFALRVTPSSVSMPAGGTMPLRIHVLREDGFDGEVKLQLKDAPAGFTIAGGTIPAGSNMVDITLTAPFNTDEPMYALDFQGSAVIGGQTVTRPAMPAEDLMQAFLYRHLVPSQEFLVSVAKKGGRFPAVKIVGRETVLLTAGGSTEVVLRTIGKKSWMFKDVKLALYQGPEGISVSDVKTQGREMSFVIKAEKDALAKGFQGNLILEALREYFPKGKNGKPLKTKKNYTIGAIPAIPLIVKAP
ncbi:MAG: hypothetical protein K9M75_04410 [Phycisphaerae bacterium]|nr:hypothetical protein [Phycisphaerae bacterium]